VVFVGIFVDYNGNLSATPPGGYWLYLSQDEHITELIAIMATVCDELFAVVLGDEIVRLHVILTLGQLSQYAAWEYRDHRLSRKASSLNRHDFSQWLNTLIRLWLQ
jgi:hypothetical protein